MQNFRITQWFKSYSRGSKLLTTPVCRVILSGGKFIMKNNKFWGRYTNLAFHPRRLATDVSEYLDAYSYLYFVSHNNYGHQCCQFTLFVYICTISPRKIYLRGVNMATFCTRS
uniref:Uncharacterized protein n=1 Tax=Cacopsylla melanoneura TaxID=428564 RepID=A0A8D8X1A8_9HEMI